MNAIRVLVADDHGIVREGVKRILELEDGLEVVGEAQDGLDAIEKYSLLKPDVMVVDLDMPRLNGLEVTRQVCSGDVTPKVIILSGYDSESSLRSALEAGATGYVLKGARPHELVQAVRMVSAGRFYFSESLQTDVVNVFLKRPEPVIKRDLYHDLTERERQVFLLIVEGNSTQQMADLLCVSPKTVEKHRAAIVRKLGISNPVDMVRYAIRYQLIEADIWGSKQA